MIRSCLASVALLLLAGCFGGGPEEPETEPTTSLLYSALALQELDAGRLASARVELAKAQREAELVDDLPGRAAAWNNLGLLRRAEGALAAESGADPAIEEELCREALQCHERALRLHPSPGARARTLEHLATVHLALGEPERARERIDAATRLRERVEDERGRASNHLTRAAVAAAEGRSERAREHNRAARELGRQLGDARIRAAALANEAAIHEREGRPEEARSRMESALELDRESGSVGVIARDLSRLRRICRDLGDLPASIDYALREAALRLRLAEAQKLEGVETTQAAVARRILDEVEATSTLDREGYEGNELDRLRQILGGILSGESP